MRRSKTELYVHLVWATMGRVPVLHHAVEASVRACLVSETADLRCQVLAIGTNDDHVHMVVRLHPTVSVARLAKQIKGASSRMVNESYTLEETFRWQQGYGAFTVSRSHVPRVVSYVQRQREHHAAGRVWSEWEETDEDADNTGEDEG